MTRKEAYVLIRQYNLKDEIKQQFGKEFILLKTEVLEGIIKEYEEGLKKDETPNLDTIEAANAYEAACLAFLSILDDNGALDDLLDKL